MKALLTGSTGFVGTRLALQLINEGWECRCLVRDTERAEHLAGAGAELCPGDVTDRASLRSLAAGMDAVFHLAAYGDVSAASEHERRVMHSINVEGTRNLLLECVGRPIERFVHFSSTAASGPVGRGQVDSEAGCIDETRPCRPETPYQRSKFQSEVVVRAFWKRDRVPAVILRPCMIYGPGQRSGQFLKMCRLMKRGLFPRLPPGVLLPMVHVRDVVSGACAANVRGIAGETYIIAGHRPVNIHDFRRWIVDTLSVSPPYVRVPVFILKTAAWAVETASRVLHRTPLVTRANIRMTLSSRTFSIAKARREIGFAPSVDPEEGVRETVQYLIDQGLL